MGLWNFLFQAYVVWAVAFENGILVHTLWVDKENNVWCAIADMSRALCSVRRAVSIFQYVFLMKKLS